MNGFLTFDQNRTQAVYCLVHFQETGSVLAGIPVAEDIWTRRGGLPYFGSKAINMLHICTRKMEKLCIPDIRYDSTSSGNEVSLILIILHDGMSNW